MADTSADDHPNAWERLNFDAHRHRIARGPLPRTRVRRVWDSLGQAEQAAQEQLAAQLRQASNDLETEAAGLDGDDPEINEDTGSHDSDEINGRFNELYEAVEHADALLAIIQQLLDARQRTIADVTIPLDTDQEQTVQYLLGRQRHFQQLRNPLRERLQIVADYFQTDGTLEASPAGSSTGPDRDPTEGGEDPKNSENPGDSGDTDNPEDPDKPDHPDDADDSDRSDEPGGPDEPDDSDEPDDLAQPEEPGQPENPDDPDDSDDSDDPESARRHRNDLGQGWVYITSFGNGEWAGCRLYVKQNAYGVIVDRVVIKDVDMPDSVSGNVLHKSGLPNEVVALYRLRDLDGSQNVVDLRGWYMAPNRMSGEPLKYHIYMEYCPLGDMYQVFMDLSSAYSRYNAAHPDYPVYVPEAFAWAVFEDLATAGLLMERGTLGEPGSGAWEQILHRDIRATNVLLGINDTGRYKGYPAAKIGGFGHVVMLPGDDRRTGGFETAQYAAGDLHLGRGRWWDAPEIVNWELLGSQNNPQGPGSKANVWQVGNLMWSLLNLQNGNQVLEGYDWTRPHGDVGWSSRIPRHYGDDLSWLVGFCQTYLPENRPSFTELLRHIREYRTALAQNMSEAEADDHRFTQHALMVNSDPWPLRTMLSYSWNQTWNSHPLRPVPDLPPGRGDNGDDEDSSDSESSGGGPGEDKAARKKRREEEKEVRRAEREEARRTRGANAEQQHEEQEEQQQEEVVQGEDEDLYNATPQRQRATMRGTSARHGYGYNRRRSRSPGARAALSGETFNDRTPLLQRHVASLPGVETAVPRPSVRHPPSRRGPRGIPASSMQAQPPPSTRRPASQANRPRRDLGRDIPYPQRQLAPASRLPVNVSRDSHPGRTQTHANAATGRRSRSPRRLDYSTGMQQNISPGTGRVRSGPMRPGRLPQTLPTTATQRAGSKRSRSSNGDDQDGDEEQQWNKRRRDDRHPH